MFRRNYHPQGAYTIRRNRQEQINNKMYNMQNCALVGAETVCT